MAHECDPNDIVVSVRQRKELGDLTRLEASIKTRGQIQSIVVRQVDDEKVLVVGGRRLQVCKNLKTPVKYEFFHDLSDADAKVVELEENVNREDLPWRDHAAAVGELHDAYKASRQCWSVEKTGQEINISTRQVYEILTVFKNLSSPLLRDSGSIKQSYGILQVAAERRAASIVNDISKVGTQIFNPETIPGETNGSKMDESPVDISSSSDLGGDSRNSLQSPTVAGKHPNGSGSSAAKPSNGTPPPVSKAILNTDFVTWAGQYSGNKFNLIHCDFPFDVKYDSYARSVTSTSEDYDFTGYWKLTDALCNNLDRLCSYSAHVMFWFSMEFYDKTWKRLTDAGLLVHRHPFIWSKTDNAGIIPGQGNLYPRRIYETAFLCSRGKRPLVKSLGNAYPAPSTSNPIHPSQKAEPVLRHFLSMLVDETTDFLDPTCGSGSAVRAAEDCGARSVLGIELDSRYAEAAEGLTQTARQLRSIKL